ncbi:MAG: bifunctional DNA-formamidopyrimidine glycosylase/DNA-(apurinic or apyrimidinic site) lyase [bacterium]
MPELPEVETIRRQLSQVLVGQKVLGIEVREPKSYQGKLLIGKRVRSVERVGKYLYVVMEDKGEWEIHLKMTGRLVWEKGDYVTAKHTRVIITMEKGKLYFWDVRKFGYIREVKERVSLGKDPWEITEAELMRRLQKTGRSVKEAILDQSLLAGVGNIYANDGLWKARVDPRRKANMLKLSEVKKLLLSLRKVMERGLATGGASDNSYVNAKGEKGSYQNEFLVYGRASEPCKRCGIALRRIVVGGRGTWICEECQK